MNVRKEYLHGLLGFLVAGAIFASYELGRARADGIPATPTMYYGVSLEENGAPVTGTRDVAVRFFSVETGGTRLCETLANGTAVSQGRARIALDETCRTAVQQNANVWVELAVGGNVVGARSRIGAVPYAVEAARADGLTPAASNALVPAGTVVAFAGRPDRVPAGWLLCDGRSVTRAMYPTLFDAIGTAHGGDGTDFNLPDYRGRFLRGVDSGAMRDPDRAARTAANSGGNTGDRVGSVEGAATAMPIAAFGTGTSGGHDHGGVTGTERDAPGSGVFYDSRGSFSLSAGSAIQAYNTTQGGTHRHGINSDGAHTHSITGGDRETRPINAAVNYIIKV